MVLYIYVELQCLTGRKYHYRTVHCTMPHYPCMALMFLTIYFHLLSRV